MFEFFIVDILDSKGDGSVYFGWLNNLKFKC